MVDCALPFWLKALFEMEWRAAGVDASCHWNDSESARRNYGLSSPSRGNLAFHGSAWSGSTGEQRDFAYQPPVASLRSTSSIVGA